MAIRTDIHRHVGEVILDYPPVNALDSKAWNELARAIGAVGSRPEVRCLLLRGEGRGFCAGVDIRELQQQPERIVELNRANFLAFRAVRSCEVPVVTAVHSFVIGGGIGICGASDVIIAAEDAYFSLPEIDRGALGGASHLSRLFPLHKVRAAFFTGGRITAAEAHRLGAVERLVSPKKLLKEARAFAGLIAAKSRSALVLAKEALNGLEPRDVDHGYRFEQGFSLEMYLHEDGRRARAVPAKGKSTPTH
ncbi:MAG TPA: enoyl-CoA hydratase family protein [Steroidobacteraceae bacterium]|nr:enoyl-CoA hydratase family protein [Steroidobacteraceae bacterium]